MTKWKKIMSLISIHPSGVMTSKDYLNTNKPNSDNTYVIRKPDRILDDLYREYVTASKRLSSFDFKREIIEQAIRFFGSDFSTWVKYQLQTNQLIYGNNYVFLEETITYIKTGKRQTSLGIWDNLLEEYPDIDVKPSKSTNELIDNYLYTKSDKYNYIAEWTTHEGGFYDLLKTMHLLFSKLNDVSKLSSKFNK